MKIANKISLWFGIAGVLLVIIFGSIFYMMSRGSLFNAISSHLETVVKSRCNHIETYLSMNKALAEQLAGSIVIEEFLRIKKEDADYAKAFELCEQRLDKSLRTVKYIDEIFVLNPQGIIVASTNKGRIGMDRSTDAYFSGAQKSTYIKDAYFSEISKKSSMAIGAPILDTNTNEFLGIAVIRIELIGLDEILVDTTGLGKTGEVYLINKYGYMITPSRFKKDTFLKQKVDTINAKECLLHSGEEHIYGKKYISIFPDYLGIRVLGTHEYMPAMRWGVLAEIHTKEALLPLRRMAIFFIFILLMVAISSWSVGIFIARKISQPIVALHKGVELIGEGNLDYKVGTSGKDEIAQLSRAFDQMADNLKHTTTSIDNLNQEIIKRERTEEALRQSEEWLSTTMVSIGDGVIATDPQGKVILINPVAQSLTGWNQEEASGKTLDKVFPIINEDSGRTVDDPVKRVLREGKVVGLGNHTLLIAKDGSRRPIDDSAAPIKDKEGNIIGVVLIFRDVTERRRIEKALRENERKFRAIFDQTYQFTGLMTPDGVLIAANRTALEFVGSKESDVLGKPFWQTPWWRHSQEIQDKIQGSVEAVREGKFIRFEVTTPAVDGSIHYLDFSLKPIKDETGKVILMIPEGRDITDRKKIEEDTQRLAAIVESSEDAILSKDLEGNVLSWNKGAEKIYGYAPEEVLGKSITILAPPERKEEAIQILERIGRGENVEHYETERITKDKRHIFVSLSISPIKDEAGNIIRASTIARDISEMVQARKELEEKNKELMKLDQLKSEFVSTVSHELRTPLSITKEGVSLVLDGTAGKISEKQEHILGTAKDNIDRLARIVNNLLDIAKIEAEKVELKKKAVNIVGLIESVVSNFAPKIKAKGLKLHTRLPKSNIEMYIDEDKIIQALTNLLGNSLKFTKEGSIEVSLADRDKEIECIVADTGIGIAQEDLSKVFDKFQQFNRTPGPGEKGTGLGLSITKGLIEMHHGKIRVESESGKGTKVIFILPK